MCRPYVASAPIIICAYVRTYNDVHVASCMWRNQLNELTKLPIYVEHAYAVGGVLWAGETQVGCLASV